MRKKKQKALSEGNKLTLPIICQDLASHYMSDGQYKDAIEEYNIAAQLFRETGKQIEYACVNRMIGEAYTNLLDYDNALKHQKVHLGTNTEPVFRIFSLLYLQIFLSKTTIR